MADMVSHPQHYNMGGVECIDGIKAALGDKYVGFLIGNVIKYCWRYEHKNGAEDLRKAKFYLEQAIGEMKMQNVVYTSDRRDVVLCRDCKHRGTEYCIFSYVDEWFLEGYGSKDFGDDWFCKYGERRDDG